MQKEMLLEMLAQNRLTCSVACEMITPENAGFRLNEQTASAGFIFRHIGETFNLFGYFFGLPADVPNTTMGKTDEGQGANVDASRQLIDQGYARFREYIELTPDSAWLDPIDTPFFGSVSRARLFAHVLFHNANHAGQLSLTLKRGQQFV